MGRKGTGIEIRNASIRVQFQHNGETCRERLTLNGKAVAPTPANLKYATRLVAEINRRIEIGSFDYAEFFSGLQTCPDKTPQHIRRSSWSVDQVQRTA